MRRRDRRGWEPIRQVDNLAKQHGPQEIFGGVLIDFY